jgi:hypothetical protein
MVIIQTKFGRFSQISEMKYKSLTTFFWGPVNFGIIATQKKQPSLIQSHILGEKKGPKLPRYEENHHTCLQYERQIKICYFHILNILKFG